MRFIEILNDRGYVDSHPEPQSVVWERMNVPIARALRGLVYVLWDLSQVDPALLARYFGDGQQQVAVARQRGHGAAAAFEREPRIDCMIGEKLRRRMEY